MASYTIYGDKGSGAAAIEMALAESGAKYEFKTIALDKMQQKSKAFLKVNPSGKMPALKLPTGEIATESAALLILIADRHPKAKLLPANRAQAYRWLAFMASEIYPMVEIVDYPERFAPKGKQAEALRAKARARVRERILIVQDAIHGPWILKTGFSVVDIYASMFSRWSIGAEWRDNNLGPLVDLSRRLSKRPKIAPVWQKHFPNPI